MVLNAATARLGVALRLTEDQLTRDMLAATAGLINCTGGVRGDFPTEIMPSDVNVVTNALLGADARTILDNIEGEDKFGTGPVRDSYFALCHTDLTKPLGEVDSFRQKNNYPAPTRALRSEWGSLGSLRFLVSSVGSKIPNASLKNKTVYNVFCVGMEAYTTVKQDGYSSSFVYRSPMQAGGPLALNASVGYKMATCPRITNDLNVLRLRCTLLG